MKKNSGFTLIELMVVIAIIAILTAIIMVNFSAAKSKSRDGKRISDIAQIQLALAGYFNQCNSYPTPHNGTIDSTLLTQANAHCPSGIHLNTFISQIPTPSAETGQTAYAYFVNSTTPPSDYILETTLENNAGSLNNSLSAIPSGIVTSGANSSAGYCDATVHYCVSPK
jgi:prepilin-type N-terminal cleavage/methylation domain-containing protein